MTARFGCIVAFNHRLRNSLVAFSFLATTFSLTDGSAIAHGRRAPIAATPLQPVVLMFGGFASCPTGKHTPKTMHLYKVAKSVLNDINQLYTRPAHYLLACYGRSNLTFRFYSSVHGSRLYRSHRLHDMEKALGHIAAKAGTNNAFYIIGHSYGGWTAMKMAAALPTTAKIRRLITLDPISRKECSPIRFVNAFLRTHIRGGKTEPGCTRAPRDLAALGKIIRAKTHEWHNYYQKRFADLHSDVIKDAHRNFKVSWGTWGPARFREHILFDRSVSFFKRLRTDIRRDYSRLLTRESATERYF